MVTDARAYYSPRAAAGATGTRLSLRPLISDGGTFKQTSDASRREIAETWIVLIRQPASNEFCLRSANHKPGVLRAAVERVAYHVAFEDSGLGCSIGDCRCVRARRMVAEPTSLHRHRRRLGRDRFRSLARRPSRQFHRRSGSRDRAGADIDGDEAADFAVVDDSTETGAPETGACEATAATLSVAVSASRAGSAPVIYLSKDGPADYRIFVRSKTFTARDAAALIVGAGDGHPHLTAASL